MSPSHDTHRKRKRDEKEIHENDFFINSRTITIEMFTVYKYTVHTWR